MEGDRMVEDQEQVEKAYPPCLGVVLADDPEKTGAWHTEITSCSLVYSTSDVMVDKIGRTLIRMFGIGGGRSINVLNLPEDDPLRVRALRFVHMHIKVLDEIEEQMEKR